MDAAWTAPALRNLEEIGKFYSRDSPVAASNVIRCIFEQAHNAAQFPQIGRIGRIAATRELVVTGTPFILAYRTAQNGIEILAVFHGARKWPNTFV